MDQTGNYESKKTLWSTKPGREMVTVELLKEQSVMLFKEDWFCFSRTSLITCYYSLQISVYKLLFLLKSPFYFKTHDRVKYMHIVLGTVRGFTC